MRLPALAASGLVLLAGCATPDRVILLPDDEGKVGRIMVFHEGEGTLLDSPYAVALAQPGIAVDRDSSSAGSVNKEFKSVLEALPPPPATYELYFASDSDELSDDSRAEAPTILAEVARRAAAEVVVIGHTDAQGSEDYNDQLSIVRAKAVRAQLIKLGVDSKRIKVEGRGKRDQKVPTQDGVPNALNRRAEIVVR